MESKSRSSLCAGAVADEVIEKDLEIARQTGATKDRIALSRVASLSKKRGTSYQEKNLSGRGKLDLG
jgi:hypothetical protein